MPGSYRLQEWLEAAEPVFYQAVQWRDLRPGRLAGMGGVFFLASVAVTGWNARSSDDRVMTQRAADAWSYFEDEIRATAARVGPDRAVEAYFGSPELRDLSRATRYERLNRAQSAEELRSYGQLISSVHGSIYQWQFRILDWDSYYQSTLETLTSGPVTAAIAGGEAVARGGMTPTREDWEAGVRLAQLSGSVGSVLQALLEGRFRNAPAEPSSPSRPVAADIRSAQDPEVVKPRERAVTNSAREVERGPGRIQGPSDPEPPPGPGPPPVPEPPSGPEPAMTRRRRPPAPARPPGGPPSGRGATRPQASAGRLRRAPGPPPELFTAEAATRAGLNRAQTTAIVGSLLEVMNNLPNLIGQNRLNIWRGGRTDPRRTSVVDYVAGAIVAENLMTHDDAFTQARSEAEDLALSARLGSPVQFIKGALQAQSGSRFDVTPGQAAPRRRAPRSSQLGDGMFAVIVNQQTGGQPTGAKDLYVLGVAEVKLESQVPKLPAQVAKTHERLEALGVQIGNDLYLPAEQARPGQNRLFTAADLHAPIRWIIGAPNDSQPAGGWGMLQQRTSDRGAGRPPRNVRVIRLGLSNAAIRRYSEHLLNILTEDDAQPESP